MERRSVQAVRAPECFAPPQPGSKGDETPRFFAREPPINNVDLSIAKNLGIAHGSKFEIRLDIFNALNTVQFTTVNNTVNFRSLTDPTITNLPYDAQGNLGSGTDSARSAALRRHGHSSSSHASRSEAVSGTAARGVSSLALGQWT
jgi:hypothetical protein